jgi:mannose-6-phosphate isomerase-like protein (cupin superfamily)
MQHRSEPIVRNSHLVSVDFDAVTSFPDEHTLQLLVGTNEGVTVPSILYSGKEAGNETPGDGQFHTHPFDQYFYMLTGTMMVHIEGDEPFRMSPGDIVYYRAGVPHRTWVDDPEKVYHLTINIPVKS